MKQMKTLLKSLIVPKLEYALPVWSPPDKTCINLLESIQKTFTRKIREFQMWWDEGETWICETGYWKRLKALKILSLQRRRERYLIMVLYKMISGEQKAIGFDRSDITYSDRRNLIIKTPTRKGKSWLKSLR